MDVYQSLEELRLQLSIYEIQDAFYVMTVYPRSQKLQIQGDMSSRLIDKLRYLLSEHYGITDVAFALVDNYVEATVNLKGIPVEITLT